MAKQTTIQESKDYWMNELYKTRAALSEYKMDVKAGKLIDMPLYEYELEMEVRIAERALTRLNKK